MRATLLSCMSNLPQTANTTSSTKTMTGGIPVPPATVRSTKGAVWCRKREYQVVTGHTPALPALFTAGQQPGITPGQGTQPTRIRHRNSLWTRVLSRADLLSPPVSKLHEWDGAVRRRNAVMRGVTHTESAGTDQPPHSAEAQPFFWFRSDTPLIPPLNGTSRENRSRHRDSMLPRIPSRSIAVF